MGTWGAGNFENDGALDYLGNLVASLIATVNECLADPDRSSLDLGGEAVVMPSVDIIALLCERYDAPAPGESLVARWHEQYLRIYDEQIDSLDPRPDYKEHRRATIEQTFERLESLAQQWAARETSEG